MTFKDLPIALFIFSVVFAVIAIVMPDPKADKIITVTSNGITCAKVAGWSGQSCWRDEK